jgi:hypothetical protein
MVLNMKKIPTLFRRDFDEKHRITIRDEVTQGCEWVLTGEGKATRKWDGSCCAIINGVFFKRFDAKTGKPIPENAIPCQDQADNTTGHLPCWVPVGESPADQWLRQAKENSNVTEDGTYEAVGPHFNANPDEFENDQLVKHGKAILEVERTFDGIKRFLEENRIEGIVFHGENGEMCKIKRSDFGFEWKAKRK